MPGGHLLGKGFGDCSGCRHSSLVTQGKQQIPKPIRQRLAKFAGGVYRSLSNRARAELRYEAF
ncbi:hypothetical protein D9M70_520080 [compost metagenome]